MAPEVVYELGGEGHRYELSKNEISIGRSPDNDLVIRDTSISRHHAKLQQTDGTWSVVDLGSKNGTHVNEVGSPRKDLRHGDEILLGKFPIQFVEPAEEQAVQLTTKPQSQIDDVSGTIFRSAVDFSALAAQAPDRVERQKPVEGERLQKLVKVLTGLSRALLATKPLDETLRELLDMIFEHLPVERGCIMLWDDEREDLVSRAKKTRNPKDGEDAAIEISRTIAEKVYQEKVSVITMDAPSDFAGSQSVLSLGIRAAMAAPLWRDGDVDGIIYVDTPLHVKPLDDFDLDLLSALGNHAALALEQQAHAGAAPPGARLPRAPRALSLARSGGADQAGRRGRDPRRRRTRRDRALRRRRGLHDAVRGPGAARGGRAPQSLFQPHGRHGVPA